VHRQQQQKALHHLRGLAAHQVMAEQQKALHHLRGSPAQQVMAAQNSHCQSQSLWSPRLHPAGLARPLGRRPFVCGTHASKRANLP